MTRPVIRYRDVFPQQVITDIVDERSETVALFNAVGAAEFLLLTILHDGAAGGDVTSAIRLEVRQVALPTTNLLEADNLNRLFMYRADQDKLEGGSFARILDGADPAKNELNLQVFGQSRQTIGPLSAYIYLHLKAVGTPYTSDPNKTITIDINGYG